MLAGRSLRTLRGASWLTFLQATGMASPGLARQLTKARGEQSMAKDVNLQQGLNCCWPISGV